MMIGFVIVLIFFFLPIFQGKNSLDYMDNLYNSISKASAYYIPKVTEETKGYLGDMVSLTLHMKDDQTAEQCARLFEKGGVEEIALSGNMLTASGDLGKILKNCLDDAEAMYRNDSDQISKKYGYDARLALYNWWLTFGEMDKDLKKQKKFREAKIVTEVKDKAVECSYNYFGIEPQKIKDKIGVVIFSLIFYVIYTLWYGFAYMYMFEGWGMQLEH
jgi:lipopolysaccharide assembly outer membrane protein LptD (OstA)